MKLIKSLLLYLLFSFIPLGLFGQGFGQWICHYATFDDSDNGTGERTISVAVYGEDDFIALCADFSSESFYLVGYKDADSANGRLGTYAYNPVGQTTGWFNGFDQTFLDRAKDLEHRKVGDDDLIFVANNDPDKNILVFKMTPDSFMTHPMRLSTAQGAFDQKNRWALDLDDAGRVYVTTEGDSLNPSEIYIFESPDNEPAWSAGHTAAPLQTITLPENGDARGVTVNPEGTVIYVSNYVTKKVYCYIGDAENGYTLYEGFNFEVTDEVTDGTTTIYPGPWGLNYIPGNNILFISSGDDFENNSLGYSYGKVFIVNPNTGEQIGLIDCAQWNFDKTGVYNSASRGDASGYATPFNCDFDDLKNAYIVSYYSWRVDKWVFTNDVLPVIDITITNVERDNTAIADEFNLLQNYPNPFNPTTAIQFSVVERGEITLSIYSLTGELITNLINSAEFGSGVYNITFDASKLASGTYIYTITNGKTSISKKMTLLK